MTSKLVFRVGMNLEDIDAEIAADCEAAVAAADRGERFEAKRAIDFEDWTTFFRTMTPNRIAILEHVATRGRVASTRALARALGRDYAAVHADVAELAKLGLLERDGNALCCEVEPNRAELAAV